jgi:3-oxoacyl-[acyl-carrier protein] reductase
MDTKGKNVIVTGGASGFGLEIVKRFCNQGSTVAVLDIDKDKLMTLEENYPSVFCFTCDVSQADQVVNAINKIYDQLGDIDILINNAGIMKSAPLVNILERENRRHSIELWHQVISVNLDSVFYLTANVSDRMLRSRRKGVIVNVSSIAARGNAGQSAYSASKAGVEALTKVWAKELSPFGIRCAAVAPGFSDTQGTSDALEEQMLSRWVSQVPLRRLGTTEEVVDAIFFIIANDFYNGKILQIDGGLLI